MNAAFLVHYVFLYTVLILSHSRPLVTPLYPSTTN
jgi:hypothetical protein